MPSHTSLPSTSLKLGELDCWHFIHGQAQLLIAKQGAQVLS